MITDTCIYLDYLIDQSIVHWTNRKQKLKYLKKIFFNYEKKITITFWLIFNFVFEFVDKYLILKLFFKWYWWKATNVFKVQISSDA